VRAWECSRCGISPEDGEELFGRWLARAFLRYEIRREGERANVEFQPGGVLGLTCPGCKTRTDGGVLKTLPQLGQELLTRLEDPTPRS
jgi:hypothetical protein